MHPIFATTQTEKEFFTTERCHIIEIVNRIDHPELSIARARVEPGVKTKWHTVEAREVYYVLSGTGRAEIGEERQTLRPGDIASIPPGVPQRISNVGTEDLVFLCICTPRFTTGGYRELNF